MKEAPPTWEDLSADQRYSSLSGGERLALLDRWNADVKAHLADEWDEAAATAYVQKQRDQIAAEGQHPLSTLARSAAAGVASAGVEALRALGQLHQHGEDALRYVLGDYAQPVADAIGGVGTLAKKALPYTQGIADAIDDVYAPDSELNPISATVGAGAGQMVGMLPVALTTGPAGVLAQGAAQGYAAGADTAAELGIENPLGKMALGAGFGAAEVATDKIAGFGSGALREGVQGMVQRLAGKATRNMLGEAAEEPATGILQDAMALGAGIAAGADAAALQQYDPTTAAYWKKRGYEALGGLAGGATMAGVVGLANRAATTEPQSAVSSQQSAVSNQQSAVSNQQSAVSNQQSAPPSSLQRIAQDAGRSEATSIFPAADDSSTGTQDSTLPSNGLPATPLSPVRRKMTERTLVSQGVESALAAQIADSLGVTDDMPPEQLREFETSQFQAMGGVLPDELPKRHLDQPEVYMAQGYSAEEAQAHAANSRAVHDQDVQAAHEANRRLTLPRVKMSSPPAKGSGKTQLSQVKPGDAWGAVKSLFKTKRSADALVPVTGDQDNIVKSVEAMITQTPVIKDADGLPIRMDLPEPTGNSTLSPTLRRVWHLLAGKGKSNLEARRARTALSVPATLQDYHAKIQLPSRAVAYVRTYADGTQHAVITIESPNRERVVVGQEVVAHGLETQFPLDPKLKSEIERGTILKNRTESSALPSATSSGVVPGTHRPGSTLMATATATSASEVKSSIKPSLPSVNSAKPGIPADQARQAVRNLSQVAPELTQRTVIIPNRDSLNEHQWHPEDWAAFTTTEGFYHAQSGLTFLFTDNITRRPAETPARAAARVILHERLGHAGLRWLRQINPQGAARWTALVEQITTDPALSAEIASLGQQQGYHHLDPDGLVEEWAVRQLENLTDAELAALQPTTPLGKVWQWIKDQLNRITGNFSRKDSTLREMRDIFALCRQALARGEYDLASPLDYVTEPQQLGALPHFIQLAPSAAGAKVAHAADTEHPAGSRSRNPARSLALLRGQNSGGDNSILPSTRGTSQVSQPSQEDARSALRQGSNEAALAALPKLDNTALFQGVSELEHRNGDEHEVWHDPVSNRAVKITKPAALNQGVEGYLHRLATVNETFGDDITIEGWIIDADGQQQLVTSQPWVEGTQPTSSQIETYMRRKGFLKAIDGLWYREQDDLWVSDVFPRNMVLNKGKVMAIDIIVPNLSERQAERFQEYIQGQHQPTPPPLPTPERVKLAMPLNPFHAADAPALLQHPLKLNPNSPFRVQNRAWREMLKGSPLPAQLLPVAQQSVKDIAAIRGTAAELGGDLNAAIQSYAQRTGTDPLRVMELVANAMENPAQLAAMGDPVLKERTRRARNFLDQLSSAVANATGGPQGQTILNNRGHWMRRSYACFDPASNWTYDNLTKAAAAGKQIAGVDARQVLDQARKYITQQVNAQRAARKQRPATAGEIEAIMRKLTDRNTWQRNLTGNMVGSGVSKDTSSLMRRAAPHPLVQQFLRQRGLREWDYRTLAALAATGGHYQGQPASTLLAAARAHLQAAQPKASAAEITNLLEQQDIPAPLRALMGEEKNPLKRFLGSASFQAQFISRHEQQVQMREIGLRTGLFSLTQTGVYTQPLGDSKERSGFQITRTVTLANGTQVQQQQPIYTTPETLAALGNVTITAPADMGGKFVNAFRWLGSEAKLNKVALNPDSWFVNALGNFLGLVCTGDLVSLNGWKSVAEAMRTHNSDGEKSGAAINAAKEALQDARRDFLRRAVTSGVADSGLDVADIEAALDNKLTQWIQGSDTKDTVFGAAKGAILGRALLRPLDVVTGGLPLASYAGAAVGAAVGGKLGIQKLSKAQIQLAKWTTGNPDRIAKLTSLIHLYRVHLDAGMSDAAAFDLAAQKVRDTLPNYAALPAWMRELSRLGFLGSFISFQHEVYRNTFHNIRYAKQELASGNSALMQQGMRRLAGTSTMLVLAGAGLAGIFRSLFGTGADKEKDEAYRRALGAAHERYGQLAYTRLDEEGASFFNTSYLLPQATLMELVQAASEGKDFWESMTHIAAQLKDQFVDGSVHLDPLLAAITNQTPFAKVTNETGARGVGQRLDYIIYMLLEPGLLNKEDRIARAMQGRGRYGRQFSVEEEFMRLVGIRQNTYTHEERIKSKLFRFREEYDDAKAQARTPYRARDPGAEGAFDRAQARVAKLNADYEQWKADLALLGIPAAKVEQVRNATGVPKQFAPFVITETGPESATTRKPKVYSFDQSNGDSDKAERTVKSIR